MHFAGDSRQVTRPVVKSCHVATASCCAVQCCSDETSQASFSIFFQRQQLSYRGAQDQGGHGTEVAGRRSSGAKHRGKKRWVVCGVTERALKIKRSCRVFYCDADNELLDAFFRKKMKHLG